MGKLIRNVICFCLIMQMMPASFADPTIDKINRSIVTLFSVDSENDEKIMLGSGIAIKKNILATNCKLAQAGNFLIANVNNKLLLSSLIYHKGDLCLVSVPNAHFNPVMVRATDSLSVGERVYVLGNQNGFKPSFSSGTLVKETQSQNTRILQTDKGLSLNAYGSGLFDAQGNLIGITSTKELGATDAGIALSTNDILAMIPPEQIATTANNSSRTNIVSDGMTETSLSTISYYGTNNVGLIKHGNDCIISLTGKDKSNTPKSIALWRGDSPNSFIILPYTVKPAEAIKALNNYLQNKRYLLKPSGNFLVLENTLFQLFGEITLTNNFPLLITQVNANPTSQLMTNKSFRAQLRDPHEGLKTVWFDLDGFSAAFAAYKSFCNR